MKERGTSCHALFSRKWEAGSGKFVGREDSAAGFVSAAPDRYPPQAAVATLPAQAQNDSSNKLHLINLKLLTVKVVKPLGVGFKVKSQLIRV